MAASIVRDDAPWMYELAMEVYRAVKSGDAAAIEREISRLQRFADMTMHGPFMEEFGLIGKESHLFLMEFPRMLVRMLSRALDKKKTDKSRRPARTPTDLMDRVESRNE